MRGPEDVLLAKIIRNKLGGMEASLNVQRDKAQWRTCISGPWESGTRL